MQDLIELEASLRLARDGVAYALTDCFRAVQATNDEGLASRLARAIEQLLSVQNVLATVLVPLRGDIEDARVEIAKRLAEIGEEIPF